MSSSSANASGGSLPRLGPAWQYRGSGNEGGKGFQPPPAVPAERRSRSGSLISDTSSDSHRARQQNKFSVLGDDEDNNGGSNIPVSNSRSEALRNTEGRRHSTGKPTGRSLADLAARTPARDSPGYRRHGGNDEGGGRVAARKGDVEESRTIRFTREKLLSMRPPPQSSIPESLKHLEGAAILSKEPQDPVCWDTFDAEALWAQPSRSRSLHSAPKGSIPGTGSSLNSLADRGEREQRRSSTGQATGRWQRGVALPPADTTRGRSASKGSESDNPSDLWDDPIGGVTAAASDFSAFGSIPDDPKSDSVGAFDFSEMAEASKKFEAELHGGSAKSEGTASDGEDAAAIAAAELHSIRVDPKRPLAAAGTTIRSGSGDDVNVFEDFDDDGEAAVPPAESRGVAVAEVKSSDEDNNASSRLMKMIGVETPEESEALPAWGSSAEPSNPQTTVPNPEGATSIPMNPWGETLLGGDGAPHQDGVGLSARLEAAVKEQKAREAHVHAEMEKRRQMQESELRRRREVEESKRRASLFTQQEVQNRQQAQMQPQPQHNPSGSGGGGHSQVEVILMERICSFLENSWGRSDLVSILSTLHAEDSRVIPLLSSIDALRALIARHPRRVGLRKDPSVGAEMAVLLMSNAQWDQYRQALAREDEERQRMQNQERLEAMRAQAAAAHAMVEAAAAQSIDPDSPWFYADPQNNIQGPFKGMEMRQWLEAGYFKGDLPISQSPAGPFNPLSVVFPDLKGAFQVTEASSSPPDEVHQANEPNEAGLLQEVEDHSAAKEAVLTEETISDNINQEIKPASGVETKQNESSTQLKMLLGLNNAAKSEQELSEQKDKLTSPMTKEEAPAKRPHDTSSPRTQADKKPSKRPSKAAKQQQEAKSAGAVKAQTPAPPPPGQTPATPSAWGASAAPRKKSMSEIQEEEARRAAKLAEERKSTPRQSSGGWANVAAAGGGSSGWSSGMAKQPPSVPNTSVPAQRQARAKQTPTQSAPAQRQIAQRQALASNQKRSKNPKPTDDFGAEGRMSPSLETWCKDQMRKLNGSDDLTLVSFCMTLNDPEEIRQYLSAYLGATPQVNNFATEFIKRKDGKRDQEEWETPANAKKGRKKKGGR